MVFKIEWCALVVALASLPVTAQQPDRSAPRSSMVDMNEAAMSLMSVASGTAVNPASWPMPMLMAHFGNWNTMWMSTAFLTDTQQSGPRGGDKLYAPNWIMATAQHRAGAQGAIETDLMLSLEPASITQRRYPELFQTGETAYGMPLADAQHPHNFVMGLGFRYVRQVAQDTRVEAYFAPVGDPALGPVAFPHRASAMELPQAPISHHWQDSTHIADEVVTLGVSYKQFKLEGSGFYGSEPGENRWTIATGPINSWSARLWFFPSKNWALQVSGGRIAHPEALEPGDQVRTTASLAYSRPMRGASWSSSLIWGRNHNIAARRDLNSYLAESVLPLTPGNFLTGRVELVDKDELFAAQPELDEALDRARGSTFRIRAYTLGYTRNIPLWRLLETGIGVNFTAYSAPQPLHPFYGAHPVGGNIFIRLRIRSQS